MGRIRVNFVFKPGIPSARRKGGGDQTACFMLYSALKRRGDIEVFFNGTSKDKPFDIIHFHSLGDIFFRYAKKEYQDRIIFTAHIIPDTMIGSAILAEKWKGVFTQYLLLLYNQARVIIAVSPLEAEKLKEMGVKSEIVVIPNGIDLRQFKRDEELRIKTRREYKIKEEEIVFLSVGHLIKRKGFDTFVKIAEKFSQHKFVWIGDIPFSFLSGGFAEAKKIKENPPENLILPGGMPHEELPKFYNMADIFFFPSHQENFSVAILEAASCGLPLLLRDIPEYKEPLFDSYIAGDEESFEEKTKLLIENRELREEYSKRALEFAKKHDINKIAEETVKLYRRILEG